MCICACVCKRQCMSTIGVTLSRVTPSHKALVPQRIFAHWSAAPASPTEAVCLSRPLPSVLTLQLTERANESKQLASEATSMRKCRELLDAEVKRLKVCRIAVGWRPRREVVQPWSLFSDTSFVYFAPFRLGGC